MTTKQELLNAASWNGNGHGVYCIICGEHLTAKTIHSMDEDGNAYCGCKSRKTEKEADG